MQAMFLKPIYKDYVWGGNKISKIIKNEQEQKIAESLEIVSNKDMQSIIINGEYSNYDLKALFNKKRLRKSIFGNYCANLLDFPIIVKYIDATDNLSVQVHPNDYYGKLLENTHGKSELWYILDSKKDSKLICGFKEGINDCNLKNIKLEDIDNYFRFLKVKKGDIIFIPSGTIHAILSGILLCEIQQNCDITYRVYDWDRNLPNRPLNIEKSQKVIDINSRPCVIKSKFIENEIVKLYYCKNFYVDKLSLNGVFDYSTNDNSFQILNIVSGKGYLKYGKYTHAIKSGDCILLPASLKDYILEGNAEILISYLGESNNN